MSSRQVTEVVLTCLSYFESLTRIWALYVAVHLTHSLRPRCARLELRAQFTDRTEAAAAAPRAPCAGQDTPGSSLGSSRTADTRSARDFHGLVWRGRCSSPALPSLSEAEEEFSSAVGGLGLFGVASFFVGDFNPRLLGIGDGLSVPTGETPINPTLAPRATVEPGK